MSIQIDSNNWLYPKQSPLQTGYYKVEDGHELYFEEYGSKTGKPVVFVHGGPGGGCNSFEYRFFNPEKYRVFLIDQRGAGKSKPSASTEQNTTWKLIEDFESFRNSFKIEKWLVAGGSWGSTLALSYAIQHPNVVTELILRGIFLVRKKEIDWFYQDGAGWIFPEEWDLFTKQIPVDEQNNFLQAYHKRLNHPDPEIQKPAAKAWTRWEMATSRLYTPPEYIQETVTDDFSLTFAKIETHYFVNNGFFERDGWLLEKENINRIRHIPCVIVQGRYDVVCPATSAYDLSKAFPEAKLMIIADAGHSMREPGISRALVAAADCFA